MNIITGLMAIFLGFYIIYTGVYDVYYGYIIEIGYAKYPLSLFFIWAGFRFIFTKNKNEIRTICPNCKQTYNYKDLKDGKCPKCDIDTINIDKYYKDNPFKEKDKNDDQK
jgi:hypothetical protein